MLLSEFNFKISSSLWNSKKIKQKKKKKGFVPVSYTKLGIINFK